jgi:hypothetical protein
MIHLVGISHQFQWWARDTTPLDLLRPNEYTDRFAAWFRPSAAEIRPDAIGEEHEKLMLRGGQSVAEVVAAERGVPHIFCEPPLEGRDAFYHRHGTTWDNDNAMGFPVREGYWLDRLRLALGSALPTARMMFVCGADHLPTFGAMLAREGLRSTVCADLFGAWPEPEPYKRRLPPADQYRFWEWEKRTRGMTRPVFRRGEAGEG